MKIKTMDILRDGFILVVLVEVFGYMTTPENPFLFGAPVHPYHIIVVLMAARYGAMVGMGSAVFLALLYTLGGLVCTGMVQISATQLKEVAYPTSMSPLFIFTTILETPHSITISGLFLFAVMVGSHSDALRRQIRDNEIKRQEDVEQIKYLESRNQVLEKANLELRNRIMEEDTTFQTLYEMAKKLSTLDLQSLYQAVLTILVKYLKAEKCSFYLLEKETLYLAAQKGWGKVPREARKLSLKKSGEMRQVINKKKLVTLKDLSWQHGDDFQGKIMAAPLLSPRDGQVFGIIAIEKIPFEYFNAKTVRAFALVVEWASNTLANVMLFSGTKEKVYEHERKLSNFLLNLEVKNLPKPVLQQVASLGESILPKAGELLLEPALKPAQKNNLLTVLESLHPKGKYLAPQMFCSFAIDSLQNWYLLERYRLAVRDERSQTVDLLMEYVQTKQQQYLNLAGRGITMMTKEGSGFKGLKIGTEIVNEQIASEEELACLIETIKEGDCSKIRELARRYWGYEQKAFTEFLPDLLTDPDPWLKASALYSIITYRNLKVLPEILRCLKDKSPIVRETSIQVLINLIDNSDAGKIKSRLKYRANTDSDHLVREAARNALSTAKFKLAGKERRKMRRSSGNLKLVQYAS